jgi:hypothetical protein
MLRAMATVRPIPSPLPIRILKSAISWSPVWVPALLFWQVAVGGLRPALAEQKRLEGMRPQVEERHEETSAEFEVMSAEHRAWEDPVYQERRRRAARSEDEPVSGTR